jgi:hypothetical protein
MCVFPTCLQQLYSVGKLPEVWETQGKYLLMLEEKKFR